MHRLLLLILVASTSLMASPMQQPSVFVANRGQWPSKILYGAATPSMMVWITKTGMLIDQRGMDAQGVAGQHVVALDVIGSRGAASTSVVPSSASTVVSIHNASQNTNRPLPTADAVTLRNVLAGVHLEFVWDAGNVRYNVLVDKGATLPSQLFRATGAQDVRITSDGFTCKTSLGTVSMSGLVAFTTESAQRRVVRPTTQDLAIGFSLPGRILNEAVTIDPIVSSTAIYGSAVQEIHAMSLDKNGSVIIAGQTSGFDIVTPEGGAAPKGAAGIDGFVARLSPDLKTIVSWSYIAGDSNEVVRALAISPLGDIWVTGETNSRNLPVSAAGGGSYSGTLDGFALRFSSDLSRVLSGRYISGNREDQPLGIVCNAQGDALICGQTKSTTGLPTTGGHDATPNGEWDAFVMRIAYTGVNVEYFTFFGGTGNDAFTTITTDNSGEIIVAGWTSSNDYETFPKKTLVWVYDYYRGGYWVETGTNSYDADYNGGLSDAVVAKFNSEGVIVFSTYFGGAAEDRAKSVLVDPDGRIMIVGNTRSDNLPLPDAGSSTLGGGVDIFTAAFSPDGLRLRTCLYFGGAGDDQVGDAKWNEAFNVVVTGSTTSSNITQMGAGATSNMFGGVDGLLAVLSPADVRFATLFGWAGNDMPRALALDARGDCYLAGSTSSSLPGHTLAGALDGFVARWAFGTLSSRNPIVGTVLCAGMSVNVTWVTVDIPAAATYSLESSLDAGTTWTPLATGLTVKSFAWTVPNELPASGSLRLRVRSSNGHVTAWPTAFTVEAPATIVTQPTSATYCPGSVIALVAEVQGGSQSTFQWRKNGQAIAGATQSTFSIASAAEADAGVYDIVITSSCGSVTSESAVVGVSAQPVIHQQPVSERVYFGSTVTFTVEASGESLSYQWFRNNNAIAGATTSTLIITDVSIPLHSGVYHCVVSSACGSTTSAEATLDIIVSTNDEPFVTASPLLIAPQPASDYLTLSCDLTVVAGATAYIRDITGAVLLRFPIPSQSAPVTVVPISGIPSGTYSIALVNGQSTYMRSFVIVR